MRAVLPSLIVARRGDQARTIHTRTRTNWDRIDIRLLGQQQILATRIPPQIM